MSRCRPKGCVASRTARSCAALQGSRDCLGRSDRRPPSGNEDSDPGLTARPWWLIVQSCHSSKLFRRNVAHRTDGHRSLAFFCPRSIPAFPSAQSPRRVIGQRWPRYRLPGPIAIDGEAVPFIVHMAFQRTSNRNGFENRSSADDRDARGQMLYTCGLCLCVISRGPLKPISPHRRERNVEWPPEFA
jgi:hypothetical protein